MALLDLSKATSRHRTLLVEDVNDEAQAYVAIGAEINSELQTSYIVKVGKGRSPVKRCDNQRLKIIGYASNKSVKGMGGFAGSDTKFPIIAYNNLENYLLEKSERKDSIKLGYRPAGYTEMVAQFDTAAEALEKARELLDLISELGDRLVVRWYEGHADWRA